MENLPVEIAGVRLPDTARLRLHKLEDHTAKSLEEFAMCDIASAGMLYLVTVAAKSTQWQYLESCVRAYIDGADEPMLMSSGLEDYFLGTYFFNRGAYHGDVAGLTHKDKENHSFSAYRFHDEDPVFFQKGLMLTLRCGEKTDLRNLGVRPDDLHDLRVDVRVVRGGPAVPENPSVTFPAGRSCIR